ETGGQPCGTRSFPRRWPGEERDLRPRPRAAPAAAPGRRFQARAPARGRSPRHPPPLEPRRLVRQEDLPRRQRKAAADRRWQKALPAPETALESVHRALPAPGSRRRLPAPPGSWAVARRTSSSTARRLSVWLPASGSVLPRAEAPQARALPGTRRTPWARPARARQPAWKEEAPFSRGWPAGAGSPLGTSWSGLRLPPTWGAPARPENEAASPEQQAVATASLGAERFSGREAQRRSRSRSAGPASSGR